MSEYSIRMIKGNEVLSLLRNKEQEILEVIERCYSLYDKNDCSLPHSSFLSFPNNTSSRIIALPGYLGGEFNVAGIKWIASFPKNIELNLERASATIILNCSKTGRPIAIIEGSTISAIRTAASAALSVKMLTENVYGIRDFSIIGCGLIGFETLGYLKLVCPNIECVNLFDKDLNRIKQFRDKCMQYYSGIHFNIVNDIKECFSSHVVALTTTANLPYIQNLPACSPDKIILNLSLRDLSPEIILQNDNVVDCVDHICRANTSIHLASNSSKNTEFIRATIGQLVNGVAKAKELDRPTIFSPFGLGILDLGLGDLTFNLALANGIGADIDGFSATHWLDR